MRARGSLKSGAALVAALVVSVTFSAGAQAAPGNLDLTFSGDGKQTTDFGFGESRAAATVRQPNGKIVAVGASIAGGQFALARYNLDGTLDLTFAGDGTQTTDFGRSEEARGVALQADGKIVAVGRAGQDFALARYNPNGSLDTSFSGDGRQRTDVGGDTGYDWANGVAIQGDGKIVAVGVAGGGDFALARYNPNGSLDTSFSGDGKQTTDFGGFEEANGVAHQGDGRIVAVGGGDANFALARYNPNGSLDTSFSGDGKQTTGFVGGGEASGMALQADGKIVAVGASGYPDYDVALARYNANGSLDTSFSGDGKQTTDFGGDGFNPDRATGVALQGDGKIVAVGQGGQDFALARYNPNGSLDTSFSGDGRQRTDFGGYDEASGVALQADGKIVAVGDADDSPEPRLSRDDFAIARYNPNGALDTSFSGDGRQTTEFPGNDGAGDVALQADGKIVTVGTTGDFDFALARYNPNGSLDTSFSGDGRQTIDFGGYVDVASGVALQADGKIVAVGQTVDSDFNSFFALVRYNANGTLDTSFSGDGKQTTNFGGGASANGVAIQANGKIVAVGSGDAGFALARYNANGSLDTSFSGDGRQTTDFGGSDGASDVALQANGKIVAVGGGGPGSNFALARYNPNGSLDTGFSGDGKQTTNFVGDVDDANGVAIQGDGKIVAVGVAGPYPNNPSDFALARYNPNGSIDTSFSGDGKRVTDFSGDSEVGDAASGVAIQGDGKIVAAGLTGGSGEAYGPTGNDFALARYNPNGSFDTSFSGGGKRRTNFGGLDQASGVVLQANGKIVVAGSGLGTDGTADFALARYLGG